MAETNELTNDSERGNNTTALIYDSSIAPSEEEDNRSHKQRLWVAAICGISLFSDGYVASSMGPVMYILKKLYPVQTSNNQSIANMSAVVFLGTVFGQLLFGWLTDYGLGRKMGMLAANAILVVFTALAAGAYAPTINGMLTALTVWRCFLGIGIGAEYPTGSCAASEATAELRKGRRHAIFISVTNLQIDLGFLFGSLIPLILVAIFKENHLRIVWRMTIGAGCLVPLSLLFLRLKLTEPKQFRENAVKFKHAPYRLILRRYFVRLSAVSMIWFIYDISSFGGGIFASNIIESLSKSSPVWANFAWTSLVTFFYLPGSLAGAFSVDYLGPKKTLMTGLGVQAIISFILAGLFDKITPKIAAFCVIYGLYLSFGEFGPGNCMGLISSKSCASSCRGQYYGIAAAVGKLGAFAGQYIFANLIESKRLRHVFWISGSLNILSIVLAFFFVPMLEQDCIEREDLDFRQYLHEHGFDVSQKLGLRSESDSESKKN